VVKCDLERAFPYFDNYLLVGGILVFTCDLKGTNFYFDNNQ
jgi:hypothetical protein